MLRSELDISPAALFDKRSCAFGFEELGAKSNSAGDTVVATIFLAVNSGTTILSAVVLHTVSVQYTRDRRVGEIMLLRTGLPSTALHRYIRISIDKYTSRTCPSAMMTYPKPRVLLPVLHNARSPSGVLYLSGQETNRFRASSSLDVA